MKYENDPIDYAFLTKTQRKRRLNAASEYHGITQQAQIAQVTKQAATMPLWMLENDRLHVRACYEAAAMRNALTLVAIVRDIVRDLRTARIEMSDSMLAATAMLDLIGAPVTLSRTELEWVRAWAAGKPVAPPEPSTTTEEQGA